nr:hypothetical protein [Corynebacterium glutamicum]
MSLVLYLARGLFTGHTPVIAEVAIARAMSPAIIPTTGISANMLMANIATNIAVTPRAKR